MSEQVTVENAAEHYGIAPGENFTVAGMPGEDPEQQYRLVAYGTIKSLPRLAELGIPATHAISATAMRQERGGYGAQRTFPADYMRVPGARPDGPSMCDECGDPGERGRAVRYSKADGKRLHPDCREALS